MKQLYFTTVVILFFACANAQVRPNPNEDFALEWKKGSVIFQTGDTLICELRYNLAVAEGILQMKNDNEFFTFSAKDVRSFSFYDLKKDKTRNYVSVFASTENAGSKKYFMECLYNDNQFSILKHKTVGLPYDYMYYSRFIGKHSRISRKYILNSSTGEIFPLCKQQTLKLMGKKKAEIMSYIQTHDIKFKNLSDYISVLEYHNSL